MQPAPALAEFLRGTPFFGGLDDAGLALVVTKLREARFPHGAVIAREGESGRSMYIVRDGQLAVTRRAPSGHEVRMQLLHVGDFFGVTSLIEMEPRPFSFTVESGEALLYELTGADLYALYKGDVRTYVLVLQNINRELCRKIRRASHTIACLRDPPVDGAPQR